MEEIKGWEKEFDMKLGGYFRSKFSRDCSRNETEEEMSTEMVETALVKDFIKGLLTTQEKQLRKEFEDYGEKFKVTTPDGLYFYDTSDNVDVEDIAEMEGIETKDILKIHLYAKKV